MQNDLLGAGVGEEVLQPAYRTQACANMSVAKKPRLGGDGDIDETTLALAISPSTSNLGGDGDIADGTTPVRSDLGGEAGVSESTPPTSTSTTGEPMRPRG